LNNKIIKKKFVYLISPNKIKSSYFYKNLEELFITKKIGFFQLRLKKNTFKEKFIIGKKINKICKKYKVKFIVNDDPILAKKLNSDGCHLGQNDVEISYARKVLGNKIIGITCHNSISLVKNAIKNNASYIAIGAFNASKTKKVKFRANVKTLKFVNKITNLPIVAIGGINNINYKKLLLNKANFLAISGYIWSNKKYKPTEALKKLK
tara:strand:+ start:2230 stop:2853 length:624 start_codon:yes stop_codon:yes gene_type:complete